jgi:SAM-dependent methyltransferase
MLRSGDGWFMVAAAAHMAPNYKVLPGPLPVEGQEVGRRSTMTSDPETKPDSACRATPSLADWYRQWPGEMVSKAESRLLAEQVADLFGYQLLQLGNLGPGEDYLACCPVRQHIRVDVCGSGGPVQLCARPEQLPVDSDSIDAVILPHTLDFADDPHQVLREVERVLIPEGRLLITGFNPLSLWGLWRLALHPLRKKHDQVPWCGHFLSYPRLQDWLTLMGFDIERADVRVFRPPLRRMSTLGRLSFMERWGQRYWPMLAGVYVIRAVKRVSTLRPVGPVWKRGPALGARVVEPSTRGVNRGMRRG